MKHRLQAKDIPDAAVLYAIGRGRGLIMTHWLEEPGRPKESGRSWYLTSEVPALRWFPQRVLLAKLAALKRRGMITGCSCGCRGDWMVAAQVEAMMRDAAKRTKYTPDAEPVSQTCPTPVPA